MAENHKPNIIALDLEGTLGPEFWIEVAEATGIEELTLTTKTEPDFDKLMKMRFRVLKENKLSLTYLKENILPKVEPLSGAVEFIQELNEIETIQPIVVSNLLRVFTHELFLKLGNPLLFCNEPITEDDYLIDYEMLEKSDIIKAFQQLGFKVIAAGDSYNDLSMLESADKGIFFRATDKIKGEYPKFESAESYIDLKKLVIQHI